jgi:L-aminoadipate-semialdehyde dehydrogenase
LSVANGTAKEVTTPYADDVEKLVAQLPKFSPLPADFGSKPATVFLTGATGFLGAFILRDLLSRNVAKVICLVRAKTAYAGLQRLRESGEGRGVWSEDWVSSGKVEAVVGDLADERFGLDEPTWNRIAAEADSVLHNGAVVHWVYPYAKLRAANVISTLTALKLCATTKPKQFSFISSTSVLDAEGFVRKSDESVAAGGYGVLESDDLEDGRTALGTGYGQSKWVCEKVIMEAGKKGLAGHILRPGYVMGDSTTAGESINAKAKGAVSGIVVLMPSQ